MYFQNYDMSENAVTKVSSLHSLLLDPEWTKEIFGATQESVPDELKKQALAAFADGFSGIEDALRTSPRKHPSEVIRRAMSQLVQRIVSAVGGMDSEVVSRMLEGALTTSKAESWLALLATELPTPEAAFSFAHEQVHCCLGSLLSVAEAQASLGRATHRAIRNLSGPDEFSDGELEWWWEAFERANRDLVAAVRLLEPIEEIAANYVALKTLAGEERDFIAQQVRVVMEKRGLGEAFEGFSSTCDAWETDWQPPDRTDVQANPMGGYPLRVEVRFSVFLLTEILCNMTLVDEAFAASTVVSVASSLRPLYAYVGGERRDKRKMALLIDEAKNSLPEMFGKSLTWALKRERKSYLDIDPVVPKVVLVGNRSSVEPLLYPDPGEQDRLADMVVHESMRQQLQGEIGLVCPFAEQRAGCCGRRHKWERLYARLPAQKQRRFRLRPCAVE